MTTNDPVSHPAHYTQYPVEVIELTEHMNFCRGNAVKYIARAGAKNPDTEVEDLQKGVWYLEREIARLMTERQARRGTDGPKGPDARPLN
jgi:hypothetical protein